jgi:hypothetical protein
LFILDLICKISPLIGASVLLAMGLVTVVVWRGGTIDSVKIPGLFDVKLSEPIVFTGNRFMLYVAVPAFIGALGLGTLQVTHAM